MVIAVVKETLVAVLPLSFGIKKRIAGITLFYALRDEGHDFL